MCDEIRFRIDTCGSETEGSSRLFYTTNGNIEDSAENSGSKPSQERPSILKQKCKRYHEMTDEKKIIPGIISVKLRTALGLRRLDIPEHIYRMRHLGYPPGWLKTCEVKSDNISITGANSVVNTSKPIPVKYDWEKLHAFPGFNTQKGYDVRYDHCEERGFMALQHNSLLENFRTFLCEQHILGKQATDMKDIRSRKVIDTSTDFNLPNVSRQARPMASSTPTKMATSGVDLSDGELDATDDDVVVIDEGPSTAVMGARGPFGANGSTENGTCLLVPSAAKPALDRFSEGINDHRLFENLPNIGGTYKKVLSVLKRIQS